jgi:nucleotide-binding universal stress UspA family protein
MRTFSKILFATDFSEYSDEALDCALALCKSFGARLVLLHVINEPVDLRGFYVPHISFENLEKEIETGAEKMMESYCRTRLGDYGNYETSIVAGIPYEEILKKSEDDEVSLIVIGTHGRSGIDHLLFGSTAERVVKKASCPVMTVRHI